MFYKKFVILFLGIFVSLSFAQNESAEQQLKKIFDLCKNKNYAEASNYMLYNGEDAARKMKTTFNYKERKEKIEVDRLGKKIFALLDISDKYEIRSTSSLDSDGMKWSVVKVAFISGTQEIQGSFKLAIVNGKYLLSEID